MATYNFFPAADVSNQGWAAIGASTSMWATLSGAFNSANYCSSPQNTGPGIMSFPANLSSLGASSVIESISIAVTAGTGTGTALPGQPASLTVGIVAADQPSVYTQSTIYPTSTIAGYTVATYTVDPQGNPWDVQGLNNTLYQFWSKNGILDLVRVYNAWLIINYKSAPTVIVNLPTGTLSTSTPTISWTYSQNEGDFQAGAAYKIFTAQQQAAVGFNPQNSTPVYLGQVSGTTTSVQMTHALPSNSYFVYVESKSFSGAFSNWGYQQFTLVAPTPGTPGIADPTGAAPTGQGIVGVVADVNNGCCDITVQNTSNLLGVHMADVNIDDTGEEWTSVNCTIAESSTEYFPGDNTNQSWQFTASASGAISGTTTFVPVEALSAYTACAQAFAYTVARNAQLTITYYDASYDLLGSSSSTLGADSVGTWTEFSYADLNTSNYATAVKATLTIYVAGCASGEKHFFTHVGILPGNLTPYTSGGMASANLLSSWYANAAGTAPSGQSWVGSNGTTIGTYSGPPLGTAGQSGVNQNMMTCAAGSGSIALRAVGSAYATTTTSHFFTLNTPTGTAAGDLMIAVLSYDASTGATVTPPAGWTLVDFTYALDGSSNISMAILERTAGASEPSTYTCYLANSASSTDLCAQVVSYSGAANVTNQFIAEASGSGFASTATFTTPQVANTDPGAWRISAFATGPTASGNTFTANTQAPGIPGIQYVSTASANKSQDKLSSYTINRPPGIQSGDLMIAYVSADAVGGTITAPTGWTVARTYAGGSNGGASPAIAILKRTATSSEPASWTGTFSVSPTSYPWWKVTSCTAYRNVLAASFQFVADNIRGQGMTSSTWTPNVTNTNANAWRVVAFFGEGLADPADQVITLTGAGSAGLVTRFSGAVQDGSDSSPGDASISLLVADSNAPVAAGLYSVQGGATAGFYEMYAWEAYLQPLSSAPSPPANETLRGNIDPSAAISQAVFDSNGTVGVQSYSVTGTSSHTMAVQAGWIGLIRPSSATTSGYVSATLQSPISLTAAQSNLLTITGETLTLGASFIGSTAGSIMLTANFYRANVLIESVTEMGGQFNSTSGAWSDCIAQFAIPSGTNAISMTIGSSGHNVGDVVYWNRSMQSLGNQAAYQPGTSASSHPVWSYPEIQYSENANDGNGFGPWTMVPGTQTNTPAFGPSGLLVFQDHTIVPLRNRMYRVRTVSYSLDGSKFTSSWSPSSDVVRFEGTNWWLKDLLNPENNLQLSVKWDAMNITKQTTAVQFQGLGAKYPTVLTEGYKSDTFTVKMIPVNISDHGTFVNLLTQNRTLYLQSDVDMAWWVQPLSDITATMLATFARQSNPLREIDVTFIEVAPVS